MIPKPFAYYIFDVDGTLVDSAADICGAIQGVLHETDIAPVTDEFIRQYIGRHLVDLFEDLNPGMDSVRMDEMVQRYRSLYAARNHALTRAYSEVLETLAKLPGRKSTATTKGTPTTRIVLERFHLLPYFDHVQGTDGFPAKPAPDVLFRSMEGLGARPEECLFVGDSPADMEAAQRAGVAACAVTYGYGRREDLMAWNPAYSIDHFSQLLAG